MSPGHDISTATYVRVTQKKTVHDSMHHIDATIQDENEMIVTKMFREFTRLKIQMQL